MSASCQQLHIGGLEIAIKRKDIKNLHLKVYPPHGEIRISAPLRMDDEALRLFAISKLGWIGKTQAKFQSQPRESAREYVSGESHYFQGHRYRLNVIYQSARPRVEICNLAYLNLYVRPGDSTVQRQKILNEWYRQQLKAVIPAMIAKWETRMGVEVKEWHVKQMKTRWGTCNIAAGRIWLNLELARVPAACLEYVVVHEMTHLLERHHNARFQAFMGQFSPNWCSLKKELNGFCLRDWGE